MYTNYDFYTNKYFGAVISEYDFPKYEDRAENKLYQLTMGRIDKVMMGDHESRLSSLIQKAICDIAEKYYDIDKANELYRQSQGIVTENGLSHGVNVKSVSAGSESITYTSQGDSVNSIQAIVSMDKYALERLFYETARDYLGGTGLLSQAL